jgi:8-oxo-dGTP diphosphatase/2-hydroxy-dATP diphosphatase
MSHSIKKLYTLVFVKDSSTKKILLGLKKRGFGMNKWNGFGGKLETNETFLECAERYIFNHLDILKIII